MNHELLLLFSVWVSGALVSDLTQLFNHEVAYKSSFSEATSSSYDHFFEISEVVAYKSFDCSFKQPPKIESSLLLLRDHYWVVLHVHVTNSQHTKPYVLLACEIHTFVNLPKHGPNCCTQGEGICHNSSLHIPWWIWWGWMGFQQIPQGPSDWF